MATRDASAGSTTGAINAATLTYSHTCTGANGVLVVGVITSGTISGVTYNTVAMIQLGTTQTVGTGKFSMWYLLAPATGAHSVVVTCGASSVICAISESMAGAQQATPIFNFNVAGTSSTITNTISVPNANSVIMNFIGANNSGTTYNPSSSQTAETAQSSSSGDAMIGGYLVNPSTGTLTQTWSQSPFTNTTMLGLINVSDVSVGGVAFIARLPLIARQAVKRAGSY